MKITRYHKRHRPLKLKQVWDGLSSHRSPVVFKVFETTNSELRNISQCLAMSWEKAAAAKPKEDSLRKNLPLQTFWKCMAAPCCSPMTKANLELRLLLPASQRLLTDLIESEWLTASSKCSSAGCWLHCCIFLHLVWHQHCNTLRLQRAKCKERPLYTLMSFCCC